MFLLFGEDQQPITNVNWAMVLMSIVTMIGGAIASLFAYLQNKDKNAHDHRVQLLESKVEECSKEREEHKEEIDELKKTHQDEIDKINERLHDCKEEHKENREQIDELYKKINKFITEQNNGQIAVKMLPYDKKKDAI